MVFLPRGIPVRQNVNPARINLPEAMEKLRVGSFTGYLRFDAPQGTGIIIFERGKLVSALFLGGADEQRLIAYDAISKIFEVAILGEASLNIYRLSSDLAMSLHALLHGKYLYRAQELKLIDVRALLNKIRDEGFNGCLRVFVKQRTALIFYDQGHPLGFFHDGTADLQLTADLATSVAKEEGAKLDVLETMSVADLVLADLMASADLGPIWQRIRKTLLRERSQREEQEIRTRQEELEVRRRRILTSLKAIAGNYIGKYGVSQVEKAAALLGHELRKEQIVAYITEMEKLASVIAKPKKVTQMIQEMEKLFARMG